MSTPGTIKALRTIHPDTAQQYHETYEKLETKKRELYIIDRILRSTSPEENQDRREELIYRRTAVATEIDAHITQLRNIEIRRERAQARVQQLTNTIRSFQNRNSRFSRS